MARHERRLDRVRPIFLAKRGIGRQRYRHQRGLRVGCQRQRRFRPLPQGARKALAKRLIDLFEHVARDGKPCARLCPMPTVWLPCPGNVNANVMRLASSLADQNDGVMTA